MRIICISLIIVLVTSYMVSGAGSVHAPSRVVFGKPIKMEITLIDRSTGCEHIPNHKRYKEVTCHYRLSDSTTTVSMPFSVVYPESEKEIGLDWVVSFVIPPIKKQEGVMFEYYFSWKNNGAYNMRGPHIVAIE